jgi:hypothetical protein
VAHEYHVSQSGIFAIGVERGLDFAQLATETTRALQKGFTRGIPETPELISVQQSRLRAKLIA